MAIRPADKAGSWYPADPRDLATLLDQCLATYAGDAPEGTPIGAIVPHAGLRFSGATAGKSFAALRAADPEIILLFGAVHTMQLRSACLWPDGEWETPLGNVEIDAELSRKLSEAGVGELDERPHYGENSIELQMPFIRHCFPDAKAIVVATPPLKGVKEIGPIAQRVLAETGRRAVCIGSTDLTHYGASYGFAPKGEGDAALAWVKANDRKLIDLICAGKAGEIVETAHEDHSACGAGAAAAATAYAAAANAGGTLLEQTTSHEIMPQGIPSHFVGYASILFTA